jgi:hypothetical protein
LTGIGTALDVTGAEELEQVILLREAAEGMAEVSEAMKIATESGSIVP